MEYNVCLMWTIDLTTLCFGLDPVNVLTRFGREKAGSQQALPLCNENTFLLDVFYCNGPGANFVTEHKLESQWA